MERGVIDTAATSDHLRSKSIEIETRSILVSKLSGSDQEPDLSAPTNCEGFGRVRHFRMGTSEGWPSNPLPIVPAAHALGLPLATRAMEAQVFQNAACPWRCWYCFVPYPLLSANPKHSEWLSVPSLLDLYEAEGPEAPALIDLSGGSPDLIPEWSIWMMEELEARELAQTTFLWSDDNLSTDYLFEKLTTAQLEKMARYKNYGRVCCFKGIDEASFKFNTNARGEGFDFQFSVMDRLLDLGLDTYGYITVTDTSSKNLASRMSSFFDRLQYLHPNLPLRVIPLQIGVYGPVGPRMNSDFERSLAIQEEAISFWNEEISKRYNQQDRSRLIHEVELRGRAE